MKSMAARRGEKGVTLMGIRKVAVFHNTARVGSAWCCAEGIVMSLARQGYEVLNCGHPSITNIAIEALKGMDLIILGAPEWYEQPLMQRYGRAWVEMPTPKIAWYAESAHRDDRSFDFSRCRGIADLHYYPAAQDAHEFCGEWLPFGVDTSLFHPMAGVEKRYEAAFLGTLYPKRVEYARSITFPISLMPPVRDDHPVKSFQMLAAAYNSTKIFVNMPAYSRLLVTKVSEVIACRVLLVTPFIDHPSGLHNMTQFEGGKHLVYYDQNKPGELADVLNYYLNHSVEREAIAQAGWEEVVLRHTLDQRVVKMVADAEVLVQKMRSPIAAVSNASQCDLPAEKEIYAREF
jgi:spore maturation protein CgeB